MVGVALQGDPRGGVAAVRNLRSSGSPVRTVVLLEEDKPEDVIEAFAAGARGVVSSGEAIEALCKCIQCVQAGQIWASSQELQWVLEALPTRRRPRIMNVLGHPLLTPRQGEIVRMVVDALPNSEIAAKLHLCPHTVRNHLYRIYERLGVSNRVELILYAMSEGRKDSQRANEVRVDSP